MSTENQYTLYIDESGIRHPQIKNQPRKDNMDWFCWGGILVNKNDEESIVEKYKILCKKYNITYPLHSSEIRGSRENFSWIRKNKIFFEDLNEFLTSIQVIGFGVVVHRPGYNTRYKEKYGDNRWELCQTTHPILLERVLKYLDKNIKNPKLKIIFEGSGKEENKQIVEYTKKLKSSFKFFEKETSSKYQEIDPKLYEQIISGRPKHGTKNNIFLQIADLYIYPMVKYKYDPNYRPWNELYGAEKLINSLINTDLIEIEGIKYYCFDEK